MKKVTGVMICLFPVMIGLINGRVPPQRPTKREINSSDLLAKLTLCIAISGVLCSVQSVHCKKRFTVKCLFQCEVSRIAMKRNWSVTTCESQAILQEDLRLGSLGLHIGQQILRINYQLV